MWFGRLLGQYTPVRIQPDGALCCFCAVLFGETCAPIPTNLSICKSWQCSRAPSGVCAQAPEHCEHQFMGRACVYACTYGVTTLHLFRECCSMDVNRYVLRPPFFVCLTWFRSCLGGGHNFYPRRPISGEAKEGQERVPNQMRWHIGCQKFAALKLGILVQNRYLQHVTLGYFVGNAARK